MTELSFESFDGGGPEFNVIIYDGSIVSYERHVQYYKEDHEQMTGAGYNVVFSFKGLAQGETEMMIEERSPIADNLDHKYKVKVDENLHVEFEIISVEEISY